MTLKQSLTKIGLASLMALYAGCGQKDKEPFVVYGVYAGYQARSIKEGALFRTELRDSVSQEGIVGIYCSKDNGFSEIYIEGDIGKHLPMTHPLTRYANPDSLLAVHKALRKK